MSYSGILSLSMFNSSQANQKHPATNRLTAEYSYDAAGNLTFDAQNTLAYDAENNVRTNTAAGVVTSYDFDAGGTRVRKSVSGGATTVYIFSGSKVMAEYENGAAPSSPTREYVYAGANLVAKLEGSNTLYYHPDHLSNRLLTDASGNTVGTRGNYPFGETWYQTGSTTKLKFTSYERDLESGGEVGNDYAMAREYITRFGRFNSVDPFAGSLADPQSLNRYTYTRNDPVNSVDPLGLFVRPGNPPEPDPSAPWGVPPPPSALGPCTFGINSGQWVQEQLGLGGGSWACNDPNQGRGNLQGGGGGGNSSSALKKGLREILKNKDCAALLGGINKANQILDHFLGTMNVDTQQSTGNLFNIAKPLIDSGTAAAVTFTPASGNFTNGQFTGPNFSTFVGSTVAGYSSSAQLTVQMHEFIHAASSPLTNKLFVDMMRPNIPGMAQDRISNIYDISKKCGTALPPGF